MNLSWDEILARHAPSFFLVFSTERDIDIFATKIPKHIQVLHGIIRGKNCQSSSELFDEFSSVLQYPDYFGKNWDAFDECIKDLSWVKKDAFILFITQSHFLLNKEDEKEIDIFLTILRSAVDYWQKKGLIKIIFQTEKKIASQIKEISQERTLSPFDIII